MTNAQAESALRYAVVSAIAASPSVRAVFLAMKKAGLSAGIDIRIRMSGEMQEPGVISEADAAWLRSLNIEPDLKAEAHDRAALPAEPGKIGAAAFSIALFKNLIGRIGG